MSSRTLTSSVLATMGLAGAMVACTGMCCIPPDPPRECILTLDSVDPPGGPISVGTVTIAFEGTDERTITYDRGNSLFRCDLYRKVGSAWEREAYFWVPAQQDPNLCTWTAFVPTDDPNYEIRNVTYIFQGVTLTPGTNAFRCEVWKQDAHPCGTGETAEDTLDVTYTR